MIFEEDNLFILIFLTSGICLFISVGWLKLKLMHVGMVLILLNGL